jgi:hypothetical protein
MVICPAHADAFSIATEFKDHERTDSKNYVGKRHLAMFRNKIHHKFQSG